jgi:hypothetical protein
MKNEQYNRNAVEWQLKGHQAKTERNNLFLTFVVATIGFSASIIWMCDCNFAILKNCFATPIYFLSVVLLFITFFIFFKLSNDLKKIAFKYSEIQGNLAINDKLEKEPTLWDEINLMHKNYYSEFNIGFYCYIIALGLLITAILVMVYS